MEVAGKLVVLGEATPKIANWLKEMGAAYKMGVRGGRDERAYIGVC